MKFGALDMCDHVHIRICSTFTHNMDDQNCVYVLCSLSRPKDDYMIPGEMYANEQHARQRAQEIHGHNHIWIEVHTFDPTGIIVVNKGSPTCIEVLPNPQNPYGMDPSGVDDMQNTIRTMHNL